MRTITILAFLAFGLIAYAEEDPATATLPPKPQPPEPPLVWFDAKEGGIEGRAWPDAPRANWYDRLPAEARGKVSASIWRLSLDSTGFIFRFKSDADEIWVNYTLRKERLANPYSPAIGGSGVDLYARDARGKLRFVSVSRPWGKVVRQRLVKSPIPGMHEYAMYLPLENSIASLSIGIPPAAHFERLVPRTEKPIVIYGTSITQGAGASRPGMVYPAILGRRFDRPVINLGFSGNGKMDSAIGDLMVQIDAAVYIVDCLPNMTAAEVRERCIPFVKLLRAKRPNTPILLPEDRRFTNSWFFPEWNQEHTDNHQALRECFAQLQKQGYKGIYYLPGDDLYGDDGEGSVDGSHPNDLGGSRLCAKFEQVLNEILKH